MLRFSRRISVFVLFLVSVSCSLGFAADEPQTVLLPAKYSQFTWGGAGRYVAFHFESRQQVAVYDVTTGQRAFEISEILPGDLLAASAKKLVVISPSKMMIRRWDLESGKRDKLALIEGNDAPQQALLGGAGEGPLLLVGTKECAFYDLESLKPIKISGRMIPGQDRHGLSVHVSADGKTFGTIPTGYGPVGFAVWHLEDDHLSQVSFGGTSNAIRWAQPTGDGYLLLQPQGEVVNRNGREIKADWLAGGALIPTMDPGYFLDVRLDGKTAKGERFAKINLCSTADCRPVYFETGFEELLPKQLLSMYDILNAVKRGHEWRVQFLPEWDRLITLPPDNERILIRPFNLKQKLKQRDLDYLYVDSIPPLAVQIGETLNYRLKVQSSGRKVQIALEDGPSGAKLTKKNQLQWQVPDGYPEPWARFLLSVKGSGDQEVFHSFEVAIQRPTGKSK